MGGEVWWRWGEGEGCLGEEDGNYDKGVEGCHGGEIRRRGEAVWGSLR